MDTAKRPLKVFLCHSSADKPAVRELYKKLTVSGIDAWLDEKKLLPGQTWKEEIPKAIREADAIIICLSKTSITKEGYVQKEIKFALDIALEKPEGTIYLIPARVEECKVPASLEDWQWVDLFTENGYPNLLKGLNVRAAQVDTSPISAGPDGVEPPKPAEQAPKYQKHVPASLVSEQNPFMEQIEKVADFIKRAFVPPTQGGTNVVDEIIPALLGNEQKALTESDLPDKEAIIRFLGRNRLFIGLTENEIRTVANHVEIQSFHVNKDIFLQGNKGSAIYFIYKGEIHLNRKISDGKIRFSILSSGDCFGEGEALSENPYPHSARAASRVVLLVICREDLKELTEKIKIFEQNFTLTAKSAHLANLVPFPWMRLDEKVLFITRRHTKVLYKSLIVPVLSLILPLGLFFWGFIARANIPILASFITSLFIFSWIIWDVVIWGSDYFIVTNQRVICLEKVIGVYDSRNEESPLEAILSIEVKIGNIGHSSDYGNIIFHTLTGELTFENVGEPDTVVRLIKGIWEQAKELSVAVPKNTMNVPQPGIHPIVQNATPAKAPIKSHFWEFLQIHKQEGDVITYRKHWFVLLQSMDMQLIVFLILCPALVSQPTFFGEYAIWFPLFSAIFLLADIYWIFRIYKKWAEIIYRVTIDQILCIHRQADESEKRVSIKIEDIVNIEAGRFSLAGILFNFGTVIIKSKDEEIRLIDILGPTDVRTEINHRRIQYMHNNKPS